MCRHPILMQILQRKEIDDGSMKNISVNIIFFLWILFISCSPSQKQTYAIHYSNEEFPGLTARIFGKDVISTHEYEYGSPAFSFNNKEIYWGVTFNQEPGKGIVKYI